MTEVVTTSRHVHRTLHLSTPVQRGADVVALQQAVASLATHYGFEWRAPFVDGQLGPQTIHAVAFAAFLTGLPGDAIKHVKAGRINEHTQHLLRNPHDRSRADVARAKHRRPQIARLRHAHSVGPQAAVEWAVRQVGTHEDPPGSNLGPGITDWERHTGYNVPPGVYWCGCFAHEAIVEVGGAVIPVGSHFGYGPYLISDARSASNGLHAVPFGSARAGDLAVLWGGEHITVVRGNPTASTIPTVEGNTSSSDGSQSNGGEVALKERSESDVTVIARVDHWGR